MEKRTWISRILFLPRLGIKIILWPFSYFFSLPPIQNSADQSLKNIQNQENLEDFFNSPSINLEEKFEKSCELLKKFSHLSNEEQLCFYGHFQTYFMKKNAFKSFNKRPFQAS